MIAVITNSWALLLGIFLLMLGNGLQGTLLGVRGAIEGYDAGTMGLVMACYFAGILLGAGMTPRLLRRVGHIRVFAALASVVSASFILYAAIVHPIAWALLRLVVGFCFSGIYIVAESWLNDSATNETRGQTLSAYLIVQMSGIIAAQALLNVADPAGYALFVLISVAVSLSFAPILLTVTPAPLFETTRPMSLAELYQISPLGFVGAISVGAVFGCLFGMAGVFGAEAGLSNGEIALFVSALYAGGMIAQYPVGWLSDRMDRRVVIMAASAVGALGCLIAFMGTGSFLTLILGAMMIGGTANPLYALCIAHTNDYTPNDQMAGASSGLIFLNGTGAVLAPVVVGFLMGQVGPQAFFVFIAMTLCALLGFAVYRATQRPTVSVEDSMPVSAVSPVAGAVAVEVAQDWVIEQAEAQSSEDEADADLAAAAQPVGSTAA